MHLIPVPHSANNLCSGTLYCCHACLHGTGSVVRRVPKDVFEIFPVSLDRRSVVADAVRGQWEMLLYNGGPDGWFCVDQQNRDRKCSVFMDLEAILEFTQSEGVPSTMRDRAERFMAKVLEYYRGGELPVIELPNVDGAPGLHRVHYRDKQLPPEPQSYLF